ncbi:endonuclease/exonuclease/phosphatase family protein [Mesonia ostreae]|uniref:Endonuclease/exonuclease/phosphatase family protein n=1 Tax=Mesonia ostreae TaxID=861110 RepID=A0ABU2KKW6_9FLAO|nr:endonuclease/exonuclease/phosphatase family protein [Mesonia ostreae]MDT0295348.1 endonuclease/exonuclease/phosphatase family protein [Mesonia ostreae]
MGSRAIFCFVLGCCMMLSSCNTLQSLPNSKKELDLQVMSYNIRFAEEEKGEISWSNRKDLLLTQLKEVPVDIYLLQEPLDKQIEDIKEALTNYNFVGHRRIENVKWGGYNAIFYKKDKFKLLESNTFWLSETPEVESKGWDAFQVTIATYALLKDIDTGKKFFILNTHLDRVGETAKIESLKLIKKKIDEINNKKLSVIIGGDFNSKETTAPIAYFDKYFKDSKKVSHQEALGPKGTFNYFNSRASHRYRIDYIYVSQEIEVKSYEVLDYKYEDRYPSDHYPVYVEMTIP